MTTENGVFNRIPGAQKWLLSNEYRNGSRIFCITTDDDDYLLNLLRDVAQQNNMSYCGSSYIQDMRSVTKEP